MIVLTRSRNLIDQRVLLTSVLRALFKRPQKKNSSWKYKSNTCKSYNYTIFHI